MDNSSVHKLKPQVKMSINIPVTLDKEFHFGCGRDQRCSVSSGVVVISEKGNRRGDKRLTDFVLAQPFKTVADERQKAWTENETYNQKMSVYSQHNQRAKSKI
jgi:hypothetical protein